jgi:hypothetical protein
MPLFDSQILWRGIGTTVVVVLLTLLVLAFAVVSYVEWSSSTVAVAEFMSATEASASDPNHSNKSPTPIQSLKGRTGCPQGKRPLPTELMPLP